MGVCVVGCWVVGEYVGYEDEEVGGGEVVGLDLVVGGVDVGVVCEEEEEFVGGVGVVVWFGDIGLKSEVSFGDYERMRRRGMLCLCC